MPQAGDIGGSIQFYLWNKGRARELGMSFNKVEIILLQFYPQ